MLDKIGKEKVKYIKIEIEVLECSCLGRYKHNPK